MTEPEDWQRLMDREKAEAFRLKAHSLAQKWRDAKKTERQAKRHVLVARRAKRQREQELFSAIHVDSLSPATNDELCFAKFIDHLSGRIEQAEQTERDCTEVAKLATARVAMLAEQLRRVTGTFLNPLRGTGTARQSGPRGDACEETMPNGQSIPDEDPPQPKKGRRQ